MPRAELSERLRRADVFFHLMHDAVDAEMIAAAKGLRLIASMSVIPAVLRISNTGVRSPRNPAI